MSKLFQGIYGREVKAWALQWAIPGEQGFESVKFIFAEGVSSWAFTLQKLVAGKKKKRASRETERPYKLPCTGLTTCKNHKQVYQVKGGTCSCGRIIPLLSPIVVSSSSPARQKSTRKSSISRSLLF
jgi:hypothetical protein